MSINQEVSFNSICTCIQKKINQNNNNDHDNENNNNDNSDHINKGDHVSIEKYKLSQTPQQRQYVYTQANRSAKNLQVIEEGGWETEHLTGGSIYSNASADVKETEGDFNQTS